MRTYLFTLISFLILASSCSNPSKNKAETTEAQKEITGTGEKLIIDKSASIIHWKGSKPGGSHIGNIKLQGGEIEINNTEVLSGKFTIDMNSIVNTDLTDESMNDMLVKHLKSADFFDVEKYPTAEFTITKIAEATSSDSTTHSISGNLKMKNIEKNITFNAKITKEGEIYKAVTPPFTIDRTQWNVEYGSKSIFANLKDKIIDDNIEIYMTIVAHKQNTP